MAFHLNSCWCVHEKKNQLCVYLTSKNNTIKKNSTQFTSSEFFILSIGITQTRTAYSRTLDQRKTAHLCRWCPDFLMSQSHYHLKWQGLVPPTVDVLFCGVCIVRRSAKRLMLVWKATARTRGHGHWGWPTLFNYPRLIFRPYPEGRLCQLADCCLAPPISASTRTNRAALCSAQTKNPSLCKWPVFFRSWVRILFALCAALTACNRQRPARVFRWIKMWALGALRFRRELSRISLGGKNCIDTV